MAARKANDGQWSPTRTAGHTGIKIVEKYSLDSPSDNEPLEEDRDQIIQFESEKVNMAAFVKDGLLTVPQLNTSISEELGSKGEEDFSIAALNESYEASPVASQSSIIKLGNRVEYREKEQWQSSALSLLSLPGDSLHYIASFLKAPDWASFGQTSTTATTICRKVFTRVRIHGFLCATEVVTAWKLDQYADAHELSALYIKAGVPIYPYSLGHSYHTLAWRMNAEARELQKRLPNREEGNTQNENTSPPIDQFFVDRNDKSLQDESNIANVTYLEEKCLHYFNKAAKNDSRYRTRISLSSRANFSTPSSSANFGMHELANEPRLARGSMNGNDSSNNMVATPLSVCPSDESRRAPKLKVKAHRHLVDQYLLCRPAVNDEQGAMVSSPISLAADFFFRPIRRENSLTNDMIGAPLMPSSSSFDLESSTALLPSNFSLDDGVRGTTTFVDVDRVSSSELSPYDSSHRRLEDSHAPNLNLERIHSSFGRVTASSMFPHNGTTLNEMIPKEPELSILSTVDLSIYNSTAHEPASLNDDDNEIKQHLETRFADYQRKLETFISRNDSFAFEECMLDFWDEFLPVTENIHYHDKNTVVPRISGLNKFLSKPCPKALGVIQCEIERVKISSKRKGVNMKGRLFPAYEYRLFIRDRRQEAQQEGFAQDEIDGQRRDSILMVAKNKGRRHLESTGIVPVPGTSKKGVNNFYLYTPGQSDVDAHSGAVNNIEKTEFTSNGANVQPPIRSCDSNKSSQLGRLQSNFIGTEFQIFTPTVQKHATKHFSGIARTSNVSAFSSDNESDYDAPSSRRNLLNRGRSYNARLSRSTSQSKHIDNIFQSQPLHREESIESSLIDDRKKLRRSYSLPNFRRLPRSSRRAVANSDESNAQQQHTILCEEEVGAITYTANLLGNRPRIMDVCVPRVSDDGVPGIEWKENLNSVADNEAPDSMLAHFKQLQQRVEGNEQPDNQARGENELEGNGEHVLPSDFGLLSLQNRPPWWNVELGAFVLNFGGRVSVASVKNFQLCDRQDQEHIMLQFGRIQGRHSFTMDFQYPLTAVQAFAIAISSLQSRISFG